MTISFPVVVELQIDADPARSFLHIVPIDLAGIFTGYGPLPAVTGTRDQTGGWDGAGQTRTVMLSDGSTALEQLTRYDAPRYFSYTVSGFSGSLRFLAASAYGEWWFQDVPAAAATQIRWRYAFTARSIFVAPVLWFIAVVLWRGYMRKALRLAKAQLEAA